MKIFHMDNSTTKVKNFYTEIILFFLCITFFVHFVYAQESRQTLYYRVSPTLDNATARSIQVTTGTGFFVNNTSIITNEHVVQGCKKIKIRGAVEPGYAKLIDADKVKDLALLKSEKSSIAVAPLRGYAPINIGEDVNVMGYPLERGMKGSYLIRKAKITNNKDVYGGVERIQFTDAVEKGNSGGPLLDTSGTVIGVIVGKMKFYPAGVDTSHSNPIKTASVAIPLNDLKNFLQKNNIFFHTDNINYRFSDTYMENKARQYIVNVQCYKG